MGLCHNLWHQSILVKIFNVKHFAVHFVAVMSCLVDVCKKIFVLEVQSPIFFEVVSLLIKFRRDISALDLL